MEELLHNTKNGSDLLFTSFANDIGTQLDQLKFEFEAMENGTLVEEPVKAEEKETSTNLEKKINIQLEQNLTTNGSIEPQEEDPHKRSRSYSQSIQRAFSTVSLMTSFKSNFWKHRKGKNNKDKEGNEDRHRQRLASTSSESRVTENNNGTPKIKVNGAESEGRATIYSTITRPKGKKVMRSHTMSPSPHRPLEPPPELEQLERSESGNIYSPPVVVDGHLVYDYQYSTPTEGSPGHNPQTKGGKLGRRNSISRLLRIRKSPRKSPKAKNTPIKALYQKTVLSQSEADAMNNVGKNELRDSPEKIKETIPETQEHAT